MILGDKQIREYLEQNKQYGEAVLRGDTHYFDYKLKTLEEHLNKLPEKQKPKTIKLNSGRKSKSEDKVKV